MMQLIVSGLLILSKVVELQNSQKHTKYHKISSKSYQIHVNTTYLKLISAIGANLQIYLETSSPQPANNVTKLPGINYVAKNWTLPMMLKALTFLEGFIVRIANDYLC